jgi:hypothetical protein
MIDESCKHFIGAEELLIDSFKLGLQILEDGFRPDVLLALWRGGSVVGMAIQELFGFAGLEVEHLPIKTSHYETLERVKPEVFVQSLDHLVGSFGQADKLLIVDDVVDTGRTVEAVIETLERTPGCERLKDVRVASIWNKPSMSVTGRMPNYFLYSTDQWLVFPHEMEGLKAEELAKKHVFFDGLVKRLNEIF